MPSKSARARRREQRKRDQRLADEIREEERSAQPETIACAAVDLTGLAWDADDALDALDALRDNATRVQRVWGETGGGDELATLTEELRTTVRGCLERVGAVRARIQRVRDREEHLHLVGDRATRLVVAEEVRHGDAGAGDDDLPF